MNDMPSNFGEQKMCEMNCGEKITNGQLLTCVKLNKKEHNLSYKNILNGTMKQKINVFNKLKENQKEREKIIENLSDSVYSVNPLSPQ